MKNTKAEDNRAHILRIAEKLFADKGFDATSVDSIAKSAGVNKALIYYYFKNKDDIIHSLFQDMTVEMGEQSGERQVPRNQPATVRNKVGQEIEYLAERKQILALMFMETMKQGDDRDFLFQIAGSIIKRELDARGFDAETTKETARKHRCKALVHEFFTGVIPVLAFVTLRDKFCAHFKCEGSDVDEYFLDAFENAHLQSHLEPVPDK